MCRGLSFVMQCHQVNKSLREINLGSFWEPVNILRKEKTTKYIYRQKNQKGSCKFHMKNTWHKWLPSRLPLSSYVLFFVIRMAIHIPIQCSHDSKQKVLSFSFCCSFSFLRLWLKTSHITHLKFVCVPMVSVICLLLFSAGGRKG